MTLIAYLKLVFGYCLTGNTSEQALFFAYGVGQNGKDEYLGAPPADDGGPPMAEWVFHDLRRTLVSRLAKAGHDPITLDLLLGHKPSGLSAVAGVYQRYKFEDERRAALDHWARIVTEPPEAERVVSLSKARRNAR